MIISLIAAMDHQRGIGFQNSIPWFGKVPEDMKRFRARTMGHTVIMGRRTYDAMGKALPGRTNIVLTKNRGLAPHDASVCFSLDSAISKCFIRKEEEIFILGGGQIFAEAIALADRMYLSIIGGATDTFPADAF